MQWSLLCYISRMPYFFVPFLQYALSGVENVEADQMSAENGDFNNHRGVKLNFYIIRTHQRTKRTRTYEGKKYSSACIHSKNCSLLFPSIMHFFDMFNVQCCLILFFAVLRRGCANPICSTLTY